MPFFGLKPGNYWGEFWEPRFKNRGKSKKKRNSSQKAKKAYFKGSGFEAFAKK